MIRQALADKSLRKTLFAIAVPIAISGLASQAQIIIDSIFIGHYSMTLANGAVLSGSDFFSALGNVFFPYTVSTAFLFSLTTGTTVLISQAIGAGKPEEARGYAAASIKWLPVLSILLYILWLFIGGPVLKLMGVREPILGIGVTYLRTMSLELVVAGWSAAMGAVMDGQGRTRPEMIAGIVRSALNAFLDWVLIFGNLGAPEMGVAGAGLATSVSGILVTAAFAFYFYRAKGLAVRVSPAEVLKARGSDFLAVLKVGLPVSAEGSLWNLGNLVIAVMLNAVSADAVGIYRVVTQVQITPIFLYGGLARAAGILVGNRTGERNIPEAKKAATGALFWTLLICVAFCALFFAFPKPILSVFTQDSSYISRIVPFLMIAAFTLLPQSLNVLIGGAIRGYGDTPWMLATQVFGIFFVIGMAWLLMFPCRLGLYGLFLAFLADEAVRGAINTVRFYRGEYSFFHRRGSTTIDAN